ncbi:unnamed protein product [Dovyalis caffra]|uniref:Uncharacterized protein n=1 Tax=Dovyalis caffra TaxID=77055 RepID=A0AAV1SD27_9ROSI|nr:unnamed protein product [Dovyalis caffra]
MKSLFDGTLALASCDQETTGFTPGIPDSIVNFDIASKNSNFSSLLRIQGTLTSLSRQKYPLKAAGIQIDYDSLHHPSHLKHL